jgi:hypothetical protein
MSLLGLASSAYSSVTTLTAVKNRGISYTPTGSKIVFLKADALIEESHTDEMQITDHPVQTGSAISDHTFKMPAEVILTYGFSNTPTGELSGAFGALGNVAGALGVGGLAAKAYGAYSTVIAGANILSPTGTNKVNEIYAQLVALQTNRTLFSLTTKRRKYPFMALKSISIITDHDTENAMMVRAVCREINQVAVSTVAQDSSTQSNPSQTASAKPRGAISLLQSSVGSLSDQVGATVQAAISAASGGITQELLR